METDDLRLLFELFEDTPRQGPGSVETTRRALRSLPDSLRVERVLDLGCGTGGSTVVLAEETGAHVTAVDIHPPFLATLLGRAEQRGLADRITPIAAIRLEGEIYEACGHDYGYLCLVLQVADEPT